MTSKGYRQHVLSTVCKPEELVVIVYTISHLTFISFISSFTVVLYAQTFVIVYSHTYLTQSPNIALLSCLLQTLGIVSYIYAQYISCLLRTLALCCLVLASHNLAVTFCTLSHTHLVSKIANHQLRAAATLTQRLQSWLNISETNTKIA